MPKYQSTKTYGTDRGLSCCFRQWRASHSHCSTLHGYSLGFKFIFESETLDSRNWCFDFGGMKPIKQYLDYMFDHTVLVAEDDPALHVFQFLAESSVMPKHNGTMPFVGQNRSQDEIPHVQGRIVDLRIVPGVGCEMTAKMVFEKATEILEDMKSGKDTRYSINPDVRLVSVECFEHGANSAIYSIESTAPGSLVDPSETYRALLTNEIGTIPEELVKDGEDLSHLIGLGGTMLVFQGQTEVKDGITFSADTHGMHLRLATDTGQYEVVSFTGDSAYADIHADLRNGVRLTKRFTITKTKRPVMTDFRGTITDKLDPASVADALTDVVAEVLTKVKPSDIIKGIGMLKDVLKK